jgi:hypothetical protein
VPAGQLCVREQQHVTLPQLLLQVDTKDILFVVGGAFIDLERQLMDSRHKSSIGFGNKVRCCFCCCCFRVCMGSDMHACAFACCSKLAETFGVLGVLLGRGLCIRLCMYNGCSIASVSVSMANMPYNLFCCTQSVI